MKFSSEYQPDNRGRKHGSLGKANALIRDAAPDIVEAVIQRAKHGDTNAASLILARAVPPLRSVSLPVSVAGPIDSLADLVRALIIAGTVDADPASVAQLVRAASDAMKVVELSELEDRVRALEKHGS